METLKTIWDFFQNEVLGMNWLNRLIETFLNACGLDTTGKIGASIQFFIYDIGMTLGLLGSIVLMLIIPILGLIVALVTAIGTVVVSILKLVYLYRTAKTFREYSGSV